MTEKLILPDVPEFLERPVCEEDESIVPPTKMIASYAGCLNIVSVFVHFCIPLDRLSLPFQADWGRNTQVGRGREGELGAGQGSQVARDGQHPGT